MTSSSGCRPENGPPGPLAGWHVFTLRPAGEARALIAALRRQGAAATNLPLVKLRDAPSASARTALMQARSARAWLFSSPAAVRHAARIDERLRLGLFADDGPLRERAHAGAVYAPGPGTAQTLAGLSIEPVRIPAVRYDSEGVLAMPDLQAPLAGEFAIVGADGGRGLIERTLAERGANIVVVHVYRRAPATLGPKQLTELETAMRPLIAASSLTLLERLPHSLPSDLYRRMADTAPIVLASARLAERAVELGFRQHRIARSARPEALVEAILNAVAERKNP